MADCTLSLVMSLKGHTGQRSCLDKEHREKHFEFGDIFLLEGVKILRNLGQKMDVKFNFLQNGSIIRWLAQRTAELQAVCDHLPFSTTSVVILTRMTNF